MEKIAVVEGMLALALLFAATPSFGQAPVQRPKILGIREVSIFCGESCVATAFYSKLLPLSADCLDCGGETSFLVDQSQEVSLLREKPETSNFIAQVTFATNNVDDMQKYLRSRGVETTFKPPRLIAIDPEGHRVAFMNAFGTAKRVAAHDSTSWKPQRLIHAGWVVKDREAMDKFYRDVLGFHLYWQGGMKDDRVDWVSMQVPDGTDWVEYMLNVPADANQHLLGVMNHIALGVPSVQAAAEELKKNGVKLTEEPKIGRDGKWQLNLYDPDGTRVELMEFTPVEKPCCSEFAGKHPGP